jgi:YD repeat-containing protein
MRCPDSFGNLQSRDAQSRTDFIYGHGEPDSDYDADGVPFTWDANGDLISDGASTYSYDPANRLRVVDQGDTSYTFLYDGLGNRVAQIVAGGTAYDDALDLAAGLMEVLSDGTKACLHGRARIGEKQTGGWQ